MDTLNVNHNKGALDSWEDWEDMSEETIMQDLQAKIAMDKKLAEQQLVEDADLDVSKDLFSANGKIMRAHDLPKIEGTEKILGLSESHKTKSKKSKSKSESESESKSESKSEQKSKPVNIVQLVGQTKKPEEQKKSKKKKSKDDEQDYEFDEYESCANSYYDKYDRH